MRQNSTSVFDPVLCECIYRWFTKEDDKILDCFAGGSVRGIVASKLKRNYTGIDLSKNQIEHNIIQGKKICDTHIPTWINANRFAVSLVHLIIILNNIQITQRIFPIWIIKLS